VRRRRRCRAPAASGGGREPEAADELDRPRGVEQPGLVAARAHDDAARDAEVAEQRQGRDQHVDDGHQAERVGEQQSRGDDVGREPEHLRDGLATEHPGAGAQHARLHACGRSRAGSSVSVVIREFSWYRLGCRRSVRGCCRDPAGEAARRQIETQFSLATAGLVQDERPKTRGLGRPCASPTKKPTSRGRSVSGRARVDQQPAHQH
jgi:hypothetical protein